MSDKHPLDALSEELSKPQLPPVHLWHPTETRDIDMRIARNGDWFYQGSLIQRARMVKLFSTVLRVDDDGHTYLVTPQERLRICVEDAPFTAILLNKEGQGEKQRLVFTTNTGEHVVAGEQHPITIEYTRPGGEPSPYIVVRDKLRALMTRTVFIELAQLAESFPGDDVGPDVGQDAKHNASQEQLMVFSDGVSMLLPMQ